MSPQRTQNQLAHAALCKCHFHMVTRGGKNPKLLFHITGTTSTTLRNVPHPSLMLNEAELESRCGDFFFKVWFILDKNLWKEKRWIRFFFFFNRKGFLWTAWVCLVSSLDSSGGVQGAKFSWHFCTLSETPPHFFMLESKSICRFRSAKSALIGWLFSTICLVSGWIFKQRSSIFDLMSYKYLSLKMLGCSWRLA